MFSVPSIRDMECPKEGQSLRPWIAEATRRLNRRIVGDNVTEAFGHTLILRPDDSEATMWKTIFMMDYFAWSSGTPALPYGASPPNFPGQVSFGVDVSFTGLFTQDSYGNKFGADNASDRFTWTEGSPAGFTDPLLTATVGGTYRIAWKVPINYYGYYSPPPAPWLVQGTTDPGGADNHTHTFTYSCPVSTTFAGVVYQNGSPLFPSSAGRPYGPLWTANIYAAAPLSYSADPLSVVESGEAIVQLKDGDTLNFRVGYYSGNQRLVAAVNVGLASWLTIECLDLVNS